MIIKRSLGVYVVLIGTILLTGCSLRGSASADVPTVQPTLPVSAPTPDVFAPSAPAEATLGEVSGTVQATISGQVTTGLDGLGLHVEDRVVSGADGRARISFSNGSFVRQGPNSSVVIQGVNSEFSFNALLSMSAGEIWVMLTQGSMEVDTPSGVASVRGSYLSVRLDPQTGQLIVTCLEGVCSLANSAGGVFFSAGEKAIITGISTPPDVQIMTDEDFNRWLQNNPEVSGIVSNVKIVLQNRPAATAAGQHCVVGNWSADAANLQKYAQATIQGYNLPNFSPTVGGTGTVEFFGNGSVAGLGNYTLGGGSSVGTLTGPFSLTIGGSGAATYTVTDKVIQVIGLVKTITGSLQSPVGSRNIDVASLLTVANQLGFAKGIPLSQTNFTFPYVCSGNLLVLDMNQYAAITLTRINP
ncbi:MAG: FecR domain-containing protein [Chloroflexi bacterium]|nr:FecR domain-containing protein [Chloroflexota bacterium]